MVGIFFFEDWGKKEKKKKSVFLAEFGRRILRHRLVYIFRVSATAARESFRRIFWRNFLDFLAARKKFWQSEDFCQRGSFFFCLVFDDIKFCNFIYDVKFAFWDDKKWGILGQ